MLARRSNAILIYQDKDITAAIAGDVIDISYDEGFGRADLLTVALQDRDDKWLLEWRPKTGERMKLDIKVSNWTREGDNRKLRCGDFLVDEPEYSGSSGGLTLRLGGTSLPADSNFIGAKHSRTWKNVTLKDQLLSMMPSGLSLDWQTQFNLTLVYAEQADTPDLEYISSQCQKYGLRLKVLNKRLVVFSAFELEAQPPVRTLTRSEMKPYTLKKSATRTQYDACTVKYQNAAQGKEIAFTYPAGGNRQKIYEVTETVYSMAEAEAVAKAAFWEQNINADLFSGTLPMGDPGLYAGHNIELTEAGDFNGVYAIDSSVHTVGGSGYKTQIKLHKVIAL
jgi:phage protein D